MGLWSWLVWWGGRVLRGGSVRGPWIVTLWLVGCSGSGSTFGEDVVAEEAWVQGVVSTSIAVVGGVVASSGDLHFIDQGGDEYVYPVSLNGSVLGGVVEITVDPIPGRVELDLSQAGGSIPADDLLGPYRGTSAAAVAGFGVETRHLHNRAGVAIDETQFALGVGIMGSFEWMNLKVQ